MPDPIPQPPDDAVRSVAEAIPGTFGYISRTEIDQIIAGVGAGGSLASKLDAANASLDSIEARDFATQATLASVLSKLDITLSALRDGIKGVNTLTDIYNQIAAQAAGSAYSNFGSAGNLGQLVDDSVEFDNTGGFSSISFRVVPPAGATVVFEGTSDGDTWDTTTMRSTTQDEYISSDTISDILIGSISALRKFRVRVTVAGTAAGTVKGRAQRDASTVEGAEFDQRPDKIGALLITKGAQFTTPQTDTAIWTPAAGKRFYVSSYKINARGTADGTVTLFDGTNVPANWVSPPTTYDVSVNNSIIDGEILQIPYKSSAINNVLRVTSVGSLDFSLTVRGYEAS